MGDDYIFVGAWNGWNNADDSGVVTFKDEGGKLVLTLDVPASDYMGGRVVKITTWDTTLGCAQVKEGADLIQAPDPETNADNNIIFLEAGTYTVTVDVNAAEISIVKG